MRRGITAAVAGLLLLIRPTFSQNLASFEKRVTEATLENGLRVLIVERHVAPVVSFHTYVDVGSVNEHYGITGLAHIFEHMAFKGTERIGAEDLEAERQAMVRVDSLYAEIKALERRDGQADQARLTELRQAFREAQDEASQLADSKEFGEIIEREGGRGLNASTSADATRYFFSLPANKVELWTYLESERFLHPVLREFYKERAVVAEERRLRTESQPVGRLIEEFLAAAYKAHPYGHPTVGHMSDLQTVTREEAWEFFGTYYVPENMTLVVVGDVDPKKTLNLIERYFGRLPPGEGVEPVETREPPQRAEKTVKLYDPSQPVYLIGYKKPSINHPDDAVFDAITDVVGRGRSSRLYSRLVKEEKIALVAGAFPGFPGQKYEGLFLFFAFPAKDHTNEEVAEAIDEEIERLKTEPISDEELERVKNRAQADIIRSLNSNPGMAGLFGFYEAVTGDWRNLFRQLDRIREVTKEDIQRVVREYFVKSNRTVGMILTEEPDQNGGEGA